MEDKVNYVTCPKGHKTFVVWSDELQKFGFTCDICNTASLRAVSIHGTIEIKLVSGAGSRVKKFNVGQKHL